MSTSLLDSRSSKYISKANLFRKVNTIQVYVEDIEDVAFWRFFLNPYEDSHNVKFVITTLRENQKTLVGKTSLLSRFDDESLGKNLWLCIDSDYDDIVKGYSMYSDRIMHNKYIITTWWYSIENLKCHPDLLKDNLFKVSLPEIFEEDIKYIMNDLGQRLKEPFILLLVMKERHDTRYTMNDFKQLLSSIRFKDGTIDDVILTGLISDWNNKYSMLLNQYSTKVSEWVCKLSRIGFSCADYYQLYNGHYLFDYIAVSLLLNKAEIIRSKKLSTITNGADTADQKETLRKEYEKKTCRGLTLRKRIEQLINDNYQIPKCSATEKICQQIEEALV